MKIAVHGERVILSNEFGTEVAAVDIRDDDGDACPRIRGFVCFNEPFDEGWGGGLFGACSSFGVMAISKSHNTKVWYSAVQSLADQATLDTTMIPVNLWEKKIEPHILLAGKALAVG